MQLLVVMEEAYEKNGYEHNLDQVENENKSKRNILNIHADSHTYLQKVSAESKMLKRLQQNSFKSTKQKIQIHER